MNILFVGLAGVPYSYRACDVRLCAFANIFVKKHIVIIFNRFSTRKNNGNQLLDSRVIVKEIVKKKEVSRQVEKLFFVWSILKEPLAILKLNRRQKIDILHVYTGHYLDFLLYKLVSLCIKAKVVYQYVEFRMAKPAPSVYHKLNAYLCDNFGAKLWDASINISSYLDENAKGVSETITTIKIPPLCDFSFFESIESKSFDRPYFLFCGSVGYFEVVQLIIDAYASSHIGKQADLKLVLSGKEDQLNSVRKENPQVDILNNLAYKELIAYYKGAMGLFVPLRNTVEDIARFPNKICEYIASHGLIITTQFGEVVTYFEDNETAVIASDFTAQAIAKKLDELANNLSKIESIKDKAYQVGLAHFDLKSYENELEFFLQKIYFR